MKDNRDMPKYIAIGLLAAVLIGCVVYQFVGHKTGAAPSPPAAAVSPAPKKPAAPLPAAAANTDAKQVVPQAGQVAVAPARRDPFAAWITPDQFNVEPNPVVPRPTRLASLPPLVPPSFRGDLSISPIPSMNAAAGGDPVPQFQLTGVVSGATGVAIIRNGESERYIVREGQSINGKYLVRSVGRDGVVLTHGSRRIYLKLGG